MLLPFFQGPGFRKEVMYNHASIYYLDLSINRVLTGLPKYSKTLLKYTKCALNDVAES